jgi:hypothetical protein
MGLKEIIVQMGKDTGLFITVNYFYNDKHWKQPKGD